MSRKWIAAAALLAGIAAAGAAQAVTIERAPAPEGGWSLGAADVYVEIRGLGGKIQSVSIPVAHDEIRWLERGSLRLMWWDLEKKRFQLVADSRFDPDKKIVQGTVSKEGRYGVFGYSRWSHIEGVQERLCPPGEIPTKELIDRLCLVILCPAFDTAAWSEAWQQGTGESVFPAEVDQHFGDICDRCVGRPGGATEPAECGIGELEPVDPVDPPELEPIPNGIEEGGRAVSIAVRPGDDDRMIVASETGGLFATEDGGDHWEHISYDTTFDYSDVEYLPSNPDVVVASAHRDTRVASGGGIWRSADGGDSWTQIPLTPPLASCVQDFGAYALELDSGGSRLWAGTTCGVAYSDDGALTWSFLPLAPGYGHVKVFAVVSPAANDLKILTDTGVRVTTNGGASWSVSTTGLPTPIGRIGKSAHNQIAVSLRNPAHLYWIFAYWDNNWQPRWGLYRSLNNGSSWSMVLDQSGMGRPPFVRVAEPLSGGSGRYDLYAANGSCNFQRSTVTHGTNPTFSAWQALSVDHCDHSDVAFANNGATPLLLASDGGLHSTADNGLTWRLTGGVNRGYNALQITEVTGQQHELGGVSDLYFGTQDNNLRASPDLGRTWPGNVCCEGFFLNVPREPLPADETTVTGVACAGCFNFSAERLLANTGGFSNPPNDNGNPRLLKPGAYVQNTSVPGLNGSVFNLTTDTGGSWVPRYGFPESPVTLSQVAGPREAPVVFTAVRMPGSTPDGAELTGIKRIVDVLGSGTPLVSQVGGFGSLGTFPTMFAWYRPFGVDPADPSFFLAPDILDQAVKVSADGGATWMQDIALTDLLTGAGTFRFRWGQFVQPSTFGFDPECPGHILVGSTQAGVFRTFDGGGTWQRINGTERIPRVSSFYFSGDGTAILSSYGRGLWRLRYSCPGSGRSGGFQPLPDPVLYIDRTLVPLRSIDDPVACAACVFLLAKGGEVLEYALTPEGEVDFVLLGSGSLAAYSSEGKEIAVPVEVRTGGKERKLPPDGRLAALLAAGNRVRGLYLEGQRLKGLLVASEEAGQEDLPVAKTLPPHLVLNLPSTRGVGLRNVKAIEVTGYGFDPRYPVKLTLDGALVDGKPVFDDKGVFRISVRPPIAVGGHTFHAEQKTDRGTWTDVHTFNLTVEDGPPK
jgi:photosystem II stability/assembly factor-like uncharacterized protein